MLDRAELKEISQMHSGSPCFVSLYLNVNPLTNAKGDYAIQFRNMLKRTIDTLDKDVYKIVKADFEKIESFVIGNRRRFKKGLAILSSTQNSFWREYLLSVPVKSELIVEASPRIKPLFDLLDSYQRYVVLLVDKESARIFSLLLGEIVEYGEVHTPDVPGKHKKGGWFALSQNHYERHIDYHVGLHLKDVVRKLDSFISSENMAGILIGGSDEAVVMTREMLSGSVVGKIIGSFHAGMFAKPDEILARIEPVISTFEKKKRVETVDALVTKAMKNEHAVTGIENVCSALQSGNVTKLLFMSDYTADGYECTNCRSITIQPAEVCRYCKGSLERVQSAVDMLTQRAVEQGAAIEVVKESEKLAKAGGIGAFVRF